MCKAKKYAEQLLNTYEDINKEYHRLIDALRHSELYQQDILHLLEHGGFNAAEGYKLAKKLSDNRIQRRNIKNELEPLMKLKKKFIDSNITELNNAYKAVLKEDKVLNILNEKQAYVPRVLESNDVKVVANSINDVNRTNTIMCHKSSGKEIVALQKVDDKLYYVKFTDDTRLTLNKKNIVNLDSSKIVDKI